MRKKRTVLLFGAGAAMSWGAPGTYELTQLVRKSGYPTVSGDMTITEFIYQELLQQPNYQKMTSILKRSSTCLKN
ncbi:MAG: hypothetical protein KF862_16400 [Chitinophagaceae bacterium]|jgi:hypothetical protein|nr:hypothetical protein [Chitinophagaceae bacterium]